jgi:hypothetical protein
MALLQEVSTNAHSSSSRRTRGGMVMQAHEGAVGVVGIVGAAAVTLQHNTRAAAAEGTFQQVVRRTVTHSTLLNISISINSSIHICMARRAR